MGCHSILRLIYRLHLGCSLLLWPDCLSWGKLVTMLSNSPWKEAHVVRAQQGNNKPPEPNWKQILPSDEAEPHSQLDCSLLRDLKPENPGRPRPDSWPRELWDDVSCLKTLTFGGQPITQEEIIKTPMLVSWFSPFWDEEKVNIPDRLFNRLTFLKGQRLYNFYYTAFCIRAFIFVDYILCLLVSQRKG